MNIPKKVTIDNLKESTDQEVFDWVAYNLLRQNARSKDEDNIGCVYLSPNGNRCAAGWLLDCPSGKAITQTARNGNHGWGTLVKLNLVPEAHRVLIEELQSVHDEATPLEWYDELIELAERKGLSDAVPREFN